MKASIVIPAYNCGAYIKDTLISLLEQDYLDKEIIVVDDGSTDKTADIVAELMLEYPIIRYEKIENSGGPAKPRNIGLKMAEGDIVFLFDSDDIALPGKLSRAMNVFELEPSVGMLTTNFSIVDSTAKKITRERVIDDYYTLQGVLGRKITEGAYYIDSQNAFAALIKTNFVGTPGVGIRKSVLSKTGGFDETLRHIDDREMWLRVAYATDVAYIEMPSFLYRNHPQSISKKRSTLQIEERIMVAKKLDKLPKSKQAIKNLSEFKSENYCRLGMDLLKDKRLRSFRCFLLSYTFKPNMRAVKGLVKSVLGLRS